MFILKKYLEYPFLLDCMDMSHAGLILLSGGVMLYAML